MKCKDTLWNSSAPFSTVRDLGEGRKPVGTWHSLTPNAWGASGYHTSGIFHQCLILNYRSVESRPGFNDSSSQRTNLTLDLNIYFIYFLLEQTIHNRHTEKYPSCKYTTAWILWSKHLCKWHLAMETEGNSPSPRNPLPKTDMLTQYCTKRRGIWESEHGISLYMYL